MNKKQKILFVIIDLLLFGVVFGILAACVGFGNQVNMASIIILSVSLLFPIPLALFNKNTAVTVGTILLMLANVVAPVVFMTKAETMDVKMVGIVEGAILGAYLIFALVTLFVSASDNKEEVK